MLFRSEPIEKCDGVVVHGVTTQRNYGLSGQATWETAGAHSNRLTAGAGWDRSRLSFTQSTQFAYLNPDYTLTPVNAFEDGSTDHNGAPVDTRINLSGVPQAWSLYATDVLTLGRASSVTLSGRYNHVSIDNVDRLASAGGPRSLNGQYAFARLNPAAGLTFSPRPELTAYASYSEGSRAPTTIELG